MFGNEALFFNDIGCYTLGAAAPLNSADALLCMGAGFTLAAGVGTWMFSALQFQVDMGLLLAFIFLANMVGAIILLPA